MADRKLDILKPVVVKPEPVDTPQCCVPVAPPPRSPGWRQKRYGNRPSGFDFGKCQRQSVVRIDGKPYCRLHGGAVALDKWIAGELVVRIKD